MSISFKQIKIRPIRNARLIPRQLKLTRHTRLPDFLNEPNGNTYKYGWTLAQTQTQARSHIPRPETQTPGHGTRRSSFCC